MANALADFLGGYQAGNEITQQQRQQRQQNQLTQLAPQIVSGDPQAYAQAAAINPQAAQQYQAGGDEIARRARGAAKFLQSALQSGNQQQIMAARQTIKPFMDTLKPGSSYPLDLDPQQEMAGIQGFLAQTSYLDPDLKAGTPTGFREFQMKAAAAGLQPGTPEYVNAAKISLGQEGRASSSGFSQVKFTGPDGRERIGVMNGRTGRIDLPDGTSFDPQTGSFTGAMSAPSAPVLPQGGGQQVIKQDAQLANQMIAAGIPADQVDRFLKGRASQFAGGSQPAMPSPAASTFVGRAPEEQAAATTRAQEEARLPYTAAEAKIKTGAALDQARGEAQIKNEANRATVQQQNTVAANVWKTARDNLKTALGGTTTGPFVGRLPAVTTGQQIADGAVSQMAPVLKQIFRQAGEGTFTDKDQELLIAMLPTRTDTPASAAAKIDAVDLMVQAKLQAPPSLAPAQESPAQPAQGAPTIRRYNPATGRLE